MRRLSIDLEPDVEVLHTKPEDLTHVVVRIGAENGQKLAPEVAAMVWQDMRGAMERLREICESDGK